MPEEVEFLSAEIASGNKYHDQIFKDVNLNEEELTSCGFLGCSFLRCSFEKTIFDKCRFIDCDFKECDLSLAQFPDSVFSGGKFEDSKIIGIDWTHVIWSELGLHTPISILNCAISHSTFIGLDLTEFKIRNCIAANVDFREANLNLVDFTGTDLSDSLFSNTNLAEADFRGAYNYQIDPTRNKIKGAKFSMPEAMALLYSMEIDLSESTGDIN